LSARRNSAAGVGALKENVTRKPSLSRLASTEPSAGGPDATGVIFFGGSAAAGAASICSVGCAGFAVSTGCSGFSAAATIFSPAAGFSAAGAGFSAIGAVISVAGGASVGCPGLISILACSAIISEVTGASSAGCCGGIDALAALSRERRDGAAGLAGAGACAAAGAFASAKAGFSACWKATSIT